MCDQPRKNIPGFCKSPKAGTDLEGARNSREAGERRVGAPRLMVRARGYGTWPTVVRNLTLSGHERKSYSSNHLNFMKETEDTAIKLVTQPPSVGLVSG